MSTGEGVKILTMAAIYLVGVGGLTTPETPIESNSFSIRYKSASQPLTNLTSGDDQALYRVGWGLRYYAMCQ